MLLFIKRSLIFFFIASMIAFVIIPAYEYFIGGVHLKDLREEYVRNLNFASTEMWKRLFTFFLGLWCGKAILWALSVGAMNPGNGK